MMAVSTFIVVHKMRAMGDFPRAEVQRAAMPTLEGHRTERRCRNTASLDS
jgi:hypothetical protein